MDVRGEGEVGKKGACSDVDWLVGRGKMDLINGLGSSDGR